MASEHERYFSFSRKYASSAIAIERRSISARESKAVARYELYLGRATAINALIIPITTSSSMREKPVAVFVFIGNRAKCIHERVFALFPRKLRVGARFNEVRR